VGTIWMKASAAEPTATNTTATGTWVAERAALTASRRPSVPAATSNTRSGTSSR
jgi:hypothetical protein